ncbi:MAG: 2-oxoacid:acceptor oxidoreductase family protein [Oscillospiraceae bacterium]|nr:2-oxoacid:acceptor oxidoreductase family protein [Oscillospiraceae bacterium]
MTKNILFAGFGGQGVLFAGRVLANAGLCDGYEVSWLPSYGPETRGGTSNCSVVISERAIGSPLVTVSDVLVAMNTPSYDEFVCNVAPGGILIMDLSLIDRDSGRDDLDEYRIPATMHAESIGLEGLSNMILLGKLFGVLGMFDDDIIEEAVKRSVSSERLGLIKRNLAALKEGQSL